MRLGYITFGSLNTFRKLNGKVLDLWARILRRVPGSRLKIYGAPAGATIDKVYDHFEIAGVDSSRIELMGILEYEKYLQAFEGIDIALDPFPYNGGATTCESIWMGVPVVTLAGWGGFGRSGASLLGAAGLDDLVATTTEEYLEIAVELALNPRRLVQLRSELSKRVGDSSLAKCELFVADLEKAYFDMWRERENRSVVLGQS
jgi:predicted O-linked N-acetylglucosamine transferase (SPINDLY family)